MALFKYILVSLFFLSFSSCALLLEDLSKPKSLAASKQYTEAIALLDTYKSQASKKYNSQLHLEYAETMLKDLSIDQQLRYQQAREILEQALTLDSKNNKARVLYLAVTKLINS